MTDALTLYGTEAPRPAPECIETGRLSFELLDGGLHAIRFDGVEVIRSVGFVVRDRDWGTIAPTLSAPVRRSGAGGLVLEWRAEFRSGEARLHTALTVEARGDRLEFRATACPEGEFETNRAGFTILHPVAASGHPVVVEHSDGSREESRLPEQIAPWQPFQDIRAITHQQNGVTTACRMEGDTFEMEDQRQWSDASFKTYNRPLALPWPFRLSDGVPVEQAVSLRFSGAAETRPPQGPLAVGLGDPLGTVVPELALVLTPSEARAVLEQPGWVETVAPQRITAHLDPATGDTDLAAFAALAGRFPVAIDLEYAARCDGDLDAEFAALAKAVQAAGVPLASLFVCPSVDRQSTPPGSDWPACPPLTEVHAAAARHFPGLTRGGGMLSYFTEFNRKRPPLDRIDYIAHGTCPIVHAADDRSVMQTLTALPWILRSARAIAGAKPYRLGLSSIPMRQNPYGSRTMANPGDQRICMADTDPRHFARFGAAFTLGYLAAILPFGIEVWTPAAGAGPRGIARDGALSPLGLLLSRLSPLAGAPARAVTVDDPERLAAVATADRVLAANLTDQPLEVRIDGADAVLLGPYEIHEHPLRPAHPSAAPGAATSNEGG